MSDDLLLQNIGAGCAQCFGLLFHRYLHPVFGVAYKILRHRSEAEDILQEVFLSIFLQHERFDPSRGTVKTWILQFAYFKSLRRRRYLRMRELGKAEEDSETAELRRSIQPEMFGMTSPDWVLCVEEGFSALNERQRRVLEMVHFEGYTLQESSNILKQSLSNTKNLYYRGLKALRIFLEKRAEMQVTEQKAARQTLGEFPVES